MIIFRAIITFLAEQGGTARGLIVNLDSEATTTRAGFPGCNSLTTMQIYDPNISETLDKCVTRSNRVFFFFPFPSPLFEPDRTRKVMESFL